MGGNFKSFEQEMVAQRRTQWTHISQGWYLRGVAAPAPCITLQTGNNNSSYQAAAGLSHSYQKAQGEADHLEGQVRWFGKFHVCQQREEDPVSALSAGQLHKQIMQIYSRMCLQSPGGVPVERTMELHAHGTQTWQTMPRSFWRSGIAGGVSHFASTASFERTSRGFWLTVSLVASSWTFLQAEMPQFSMLVKQLQVDLLTPLDFELGWDILIDDNFERILHASWNGFVGGAWSAPPCREYSRLKLKRSGPKPLRTPAHPYGLPSLNASEQLRLQTQETIHDRGRSILHAVHCKGGLVGWETPPTAMTLLLDENTEMLRDWNATCSHVAACRWGMSFSKAWLMCANTSDIAALASWCDCKSPHPSFRRRQDPNRSLPQPQFTDGRVSSFPGLRARQDHVQKDARFLSRHCLGSYHLLDRLASARKRFVNDGGGVPSSADWSVNHQSGHFWGPSSTFCWIRPSNTIWFPRVLQHLRHSLPEDPLSPIELNPLKQILHDWALKQGISFDWGVPPFQKFSRFLYCMRWPNFHKILT